MTTSMSYDLREVLGDLFEFAIPIGSRFGNDQFPNSLAATI